MYKFAFRITSWVNELLISKDERYEVQEFRNFLRIWFVGDSEVRLLKALTHI